MIKRFLIAALLAIPVALPAQTALKIGHVNRGEIFSQMPERAEAEKQFNAIQKKYEDELTTMNEEFGKKYKDFVSKQDTMPENIKVLRMQEVQDLEQRIQNFREVAMQEMDTQQKQLVAPIFKKLNDAVAAVAQEGGFTYILDQGAQDVVVFVGAGGQDITPQVKKRLNLQ